MVQIKCNKCGKIVEAPINWNRNTICNTCGGYFNEIQQFQEISKDFQGIVPHILIGEKGLTTNKQYNKNINQGKDNLFNEKEDKIIKNIKKWALIIAVLAVAGYAVYRVLIL